MDQADTIPAPAHGLTKAALAAEPILRAVLALANGLTLATPAEIARAAGRPVKNIGEELQRTRDGGLLDDDNVITSEGLAVVAALDRAAGHTVFVAPDRGDDVSILVHHDITPDPDQPRKAFDPAALAELADSIAANGLLQPILVRPLNDPDVPARFMIVGGERRWRAIGLLIDRGDWAILDPVPHTVRQLDDGAAAVAALLENVQRADLTALEKLDAYQRLLDLNPDWPQDDATQHLADLISKSRRHVQDILRLALLTRAERDQMRGGDLTLEQARALLKGRKDTVDMDPADLLVLAEVFDAANGFEPSPAHYRQADCPAQVTDDELRAQTLWSAGLITFTTAPAADGQYKVGVTPEGWQRLLQLAPEATKADRRSALLGLRAKVVGADQAEALDTDGKHHTAWLNGPFPVTPEGQAALDAAKAEQSAITAQDAARAEARKADDRLRQGRAARARQMAFAFVEGGPMDFTGHFAEAGYQLPFTDTGAGYLVDAANRMVELEADEILPLVMAALNATVGQPARFGDQDDDGEDEAATAEPAPEQAEA